MRGKWKSKRLILLGYFMNSLKNSLRLLELTSLKVLLELSGAVQFSYFVMKKWVWREAAC